MKTAIDSAGRLVIPREIRREAGLKPGIPLRIRFKEGRIEIEPEPVPVQLQRRGRLLVAVPSKDIEVLQAEKVNLTREQLRKERSSEG